MKRTDTEHEEINSETETGKQNKLLEAMILKQGEIVERLEDVERKSVANDQATINLVNYIMDTDDKHLPEMTNLSPLSIRALAHAEGLESILHNTDRKTSLARKILIMYYRLLRSEGGLHLGRTTRIMERQLENEDEDNNLEKMQMGGA